MSTERSGQSPTGITVVMAVDRAGAHLQGALRSLDAQSLRPAEVLIVVNGTDPSLPGIVGGAAVGVLGSSARLLHAPGVNLSRALNLALRDARHDLVARMDADDVSRPERLAAQERALAERPGVMVLGSGFDRIDHAGGVIERCEVPCDAREVRWRLLIDNCVAHGSVLMRRRAVLDAGGYDESCDRAQDYDLWLRLIRRGPVVANLRERLYQYRCDPSCRGVNGWRSTLAQGDTASRALLSAWELLPEGGDDSDIRTVMASAFAGTPGCESALERLITDRGPTRSALMALLWVRSAEGCRRWKGVEAGRMALLREAGRRLRTAGADSVWLWGAGGHTAWVLEHADELGVTIAGLVDDRAAGTRAHGYRVTSPGVLARGEHVLLSSDLHEDEMWQSSAGARDRGVRVWRLYGDESERSSAGAVLEGSTA